MHVIYTYIEIHARTYTRAHTQTHKHPYADIFTHTHTQTRIHTHTHTRTNTHTPACAQEHAHTHTHTHAHARACPYYTRQRCQSTGLHNTCGRPSAQAQVGTCPRNMKITQRYRHRRKNLAHSIYSVGLRGKRGRQ